MGWKSFLFYIGFDDIYDSGKRNSDIRDGWLMIAKV